MVDLFLLFFRSGWFVDWEDCEILGFCVGERVLRDKYRENENLELSLMVLIVDNFPISVWF